MTLHAGYRTFPQWIRDKLRRSRAEATMANNQRITLALPVQVLRHAQRIAERRHISVSQLLTQTLQEFVTREDDHTLARARHLASLEHAAELGTHGHITGSRDSLHER